MPASETATPAMEPYEAFLAAREEIMKLKWVASEQAGHDVGLEATLLEWARAGAAREKAAGKEENAK